MSTENGINDVPIIRNRFAFDNKIEANEEENISGNLSRKYSSSRSRVRPIYYDLLILIPILIYICLVNVS